MSEQGANLSDLEIARELSRRLAGWKKAGEETDDGFSAPLRSPVSHPTAFPERAPAARREESASELQAEPLRPPIQMPPSGSFDSWEALLGWCVGQIVAEAGFVVDSQGFVIAARGRIPTEGFEGMGAEFCCALEQLEHVDSSAGRLGWVDLEFDRRRIVGFCAYTARGNRALMVFVNPNPGYAVLKLVVRTAVAESLLRTLL